MFEAHALYIKASPNKQGCLYFTKLPYNTNAKPTMPILALPNELLLAIASNLDPQALNRLLQTCQDLSTVLTPLLHKLALRKQGYELNALQWAASKGHAPLVTLLLRKAAFDINAGRGRRYGTALHLAARGGFRAIARRLLRRGADVTARCAAQRTPLHWAAYVGCEETCALFIAEGADVTAVDLNGASVLFDAVSQGRERVARTLLENGASVATATCSDNAWRNSALHQAAYYGHDGVVRLLMRHAADIAALNGHGAKPLHSAASNCAVAVARLLLEHGGDVNFETRVGYTALHFAAESGDTEMIALLLDNGAHINSQEGAGKTPLHLAAGNWRAEAVKVLLRRGANFYTKDESGETALDVAEEADGVDDNSVVLGVLKSMMF